MNCYNLTIGDYAFYGCSKLTNVTLAESIISIGVNAFYNCNLRLRMAVIEDSYAEIYAKLNDLPYGY